jgi:hypothetical protein
VLNLALQHSVLSQKRSRLLGQMQVQDGETRELENGIRQMRCVSGGKNALSWRRLIAGACRTDMSRLNDMLAKNSNLSQTLEEDNFSLEAEFINRLKDAETVPQPQPRPQGVSGRVMRPPARRTFPSCRRMSRPPSLPRLCWSRS